MFGPQIEVFSSTARRYVNNPGPLNRVNRVPWDDKMVDTLLERQLGEDRIVMQADQICSFKRGQNFAPRAFEYPHRLFGENQCFLSSFYSYFDVIQLGIHCEGRIGCKGPRCGGPDEDVGITFL